MSRCPNASPKLSYSRVTEGELKAFGEVASGAALKAAIINLQVRISDSGAVITNDTLPTVKADESQLIQVFQNLIANGIKYRRSDKPSIHVWAEQRGGDWRVAVRDNGMGIEQQYRTSIFDIFSRLHGKEVPGTGMETPGTGGTAGALSTVRRWECDVVPLV